MALVIDASPHAQVGFGIDDPLLSRFPRAVHFWAPTFKWGLVVAGLADINRPIEKVSTAQQGGMHAPPHIHLPPAAGGGDKQDACEAYPAALKTSAMCPDAS